MFWLILLIPFILNGEVTVGIDQLLSKPYIQELKGKRVGLITNHTAINHNYESSIEIVRQGQNRGQYKLLALFGPEHGIAGSYWAAEKIQDKEHESSIPIYSLHGATRRPTKEMLKNIDLLIYDIQDIGSRSYTYISTLFYCMEEAAAKKIPVIVCDRPNPINGVTIDGPMLDKEWRSFVGYVDVPYCHGMTVGELALFFNKEYMIGCQLTVIPMKGWRRQMSFRDTGLPWIPTSPNIPEADTPIYYPSTGILGELPMVSIGIGYTLPFKVVGAPWIDRDAFTDALNKQKFPGVSFQPFSFKPYAGRFSGEVCHGALLLVTDHRIYQPVSTQFLILGILKSLYPKEFKRSLAASKGRKAMFCKVSGTDEVFRLMEEERYIVWKLKSIHEQRRKQFISLRSRYLMPQYPL